MKSQPCRHCGGSGQVRSEIELGIRMRQRREKAGLTLTAMANQLDLSAAYLCDLELGRRHWSPKLIEAYDKL